MRRTAPVLSTAAVVCGLLLIAPLPALAADLGTVTTTAELRTAIAAANADPASADVITLAANGTFQLDGAAGNADPALGDLDVTGPLTVIGNGVEIDGASVDRVFDVLAGGALTLTDVVLVNGDAPDAENGGAVRVAAGATLVVTDGSISDSVATNAGAPAATAGSGGAIATAGTTTVTGTTLAGNLASRAGGAIEVLATGTATVTGATFTGNATQAAPGNGGALHITGAGTASVSGSEVDGNTAAEGGGLWNSAGGTLTVTGTRITGNTANGALADQGGGGIFSEGGPVTVTGGIIEGNAATGAAGSGGGIQALNATVTVTGTEITDNTAERAGGGIEGGPLLPTPAATPPGPGSTAPTTLTLTDVLLAGNSFTTPTDGSPRNGAGLHLTGAGTVDVSGSIVRGNTLAREGGGLWNSATGVLTVEDTQVLGNSTDGALADQGGGGVFTEGGDVVITGSVVEGNTSTGALASGGGILNITGSVEVTNSSVSGNTAVRAGGGIEAGPLLDVPTATPPVVGRTDATSTVLVGVDLSDNTVSGPPGNGGGLHLTGAGDVVVDSSLVSGNAAVEGGGLWNSAVGTLSVTDSTVVGNTASGTDGGGGLYNDGGTLVGVNVTVVDNDAAGAGGGVLSVGGDAGLLHATVTGNSTGIAGAVEIANTVLTANDGADAGTGVTSLGGNVLAAALPFSPDRQAGANDTTGVTDPRLGALADNGGPTPTRLPAAGSPVIDAGVTVDTAGGTPAFLALVGADQRGVTRPLDGNGDGRTVVDAGAVEAPAVAVTPAPGGGGVTPPARPVAAQPNYTG